MVTQEPADLPVHLCPYFFQGVSAITSVKAVSVAANGTGFCIVSVCREGRTVTRMQAWNGCRIASELNRIAAV